MTETSGAHDSDEHLKRVMEENASIWMQSPGVQAVGIGANCIRVFYEDLNAKQNSLIPDSMDGVGIEKVVSGQFEKQ